MVAQVAHITLFLFLFISLLLKARPAALCTLFSRARTDRLLCNSASREGTSTTAADASPLHVVPSNRRISRPLRQA